MINVIKANGQVEPFSEEKVLHSMRRAGVSQNHQEELLTYTKSKLYDNIPTSEIYHHIIHHLGKFPDQPYLHSRYSLKQAIMALGPTGYPFEDFVSKILETQGYKTLVRQQLLGRCVMHEIDVIAENEEKRIAVEAKFHNNPGIRSEVHVALYTKARFDDIREKHTLHEAWIVTNTKATTDAMAYAECMEMKMISWSYPAGESLRDLIEKSNLHPITLLSTLSASQKLYLLENHIVMCLDITSNPTVLDMLHLSHEHKEKVIGEIGYICKTDSG